MAKTPMFSTNPITGKKYYHGFNPMTAPEFFDKEETMTEKRMRHLMATTPGIGVEAVTRYGDHLCYFYVDFPDSGGIDRAMKQIYPALDKGDFKRVTFLEGRIY